MYTWRTSLCFCLTTGSALFYLRLWGRASIAGPTPCSWLDSYWINTPLSFRPCRTRVYTSKMCLHKEVPLPPGSFCGLQTLPSYPIDFIRKVPRNTQIIWDTTMVLQGCCFGGCLPASFLRNPKGSQTSVQSSTLNRRLPTALPFLELWKCSLAHHLTMLPLWMLSLTCCYSALSRPASCDLALVLHF